MVRSIVGVVAGFLAMALLTMIATAIAAKAMLAAGGDPPRPTPPYLAVNLAYSAAFAVLAGYLSAVIAARAPVGHALVLAGLLLAMGILSFTLNQPGQPRWYAATLIGLGPFGALLGGYLRAIQLRH